MANIFLVPMWLSMLLGFACQNAPEEVTQAFFADGPQLVKIPIRDIAVADSLIRQGLDVIVIEENYLIARLDAGNAAQIQTMSLSMQTIKEEELLQRLIQVVMREQHDLFELSNSGIDIWEVKGDTVIAQAYDKYIRQIRSKGYPVEIIAKNLQDVVTNRP